MQPQRGPGGPAGTRRGPEGWSAHVAIAGGRVTLEALSSELVVDDVYRGSAIR